jgi:hypothetical protein
LFFSSAKKGCVVLSASWRIGTRRTVLPLAAKIAFAAAEAMGGRAWLASAARIFGAGRDVEFDLGHFAHFQHRVIVEVALSDTAALNCIQSLSMLP